MQKEPLRIDSETLTWFYEQHRLLWTWISELSRNDLNRIISQNPNVAPDYAIKSSWSGWGDRWGLLYCSFACEVGGNDGKRCFKCPLGNDYCQRADLGYQKFLSAIKTGDINLFKVAALEIRDAWTKPSAVEKRWF